jgi:alpha-galactosidase
MPSARFGNAGKNILQAPGFFRTDFRLKNTKITKNTSVMKKASILVGLVIIASRVLYPQTSGSIENGVLHVNVRGHDGSYEIEARGTKRPAIISRVGAEVDHRWIFSTDYPRHQVSSSAFHDILGAGHELAVRFQGIKSRPSLVCTLRLYDQQPYGDLTIRVVNTTGKAATVQDIRVVDAIGAPRVDLGGPEEADRIMAESFSENPAIHIGGLRQAPSGDYAGVRDDLIYNLESKQSLLLAALTADRFLTISHLRVAGGPSGIARITSFTLDSTGTTEVVSKWDKLASDQQVGLSLPLTAGASLLSERVMFAAGPHYLSELEAYGEAVRRLHHARVFGPALMGWWSWTAFYGGITEGDVLTNADWLARHLKHLGYDYFHIDEGYQYARGEYTTANATQFPNGLLSTGRALCNLGLKFGIWTGPFEVSARAWVYQHHKDWLVRDTHGKPIYIGSINGQDPLYVLDTTNPDAQAYLRETYRIMTQEWGVRYIKLDFMDAADVEGYRYRPNTTALEAQRIGLKIIREAVGERVLLDKDGSPMLGPVGLVDEGRISLDTGHSFQASKDASPNIAARFYMNRNFYVSDPDAFSVSGELEPQQIYHQSNTPITLNEAQVQIVLAAVAGGMYEIGDDLPTLGSEADRLALVENPDLIDIVRLGRAALPLDLMTFPTVDEQPSVFFLREDRHQAILAVFNWTERARSHTFMMAALRLPADHLFKAFDTLNHDSPVNLPSGTLRLENQPHSVRLIKLVDTTVPAAPPDVSVQSPPSVRAGEPLTLAAKSSPESVPALSYRWEFGDGTVSNGSTVTHTYTQAGTYTVKLIVDGIDGIPARKTYNVSVTGYPNTLFNFKLNRRYKPQNDEQGQPTFQ